MMQPNPISFLHLALCPARSCATKPEGIAHIHINMNMFEYWACVELSCGAFFGLAFGLRVSEGHWQGSGQGLTGWRVEGLGREMGSEAPFWIFWDVLWVLHV